MKSLTKNLSFLIILIVLVACGNSDSNKEKSTAEDSKEIPVKEEKITSDDPMSNKGIGPVKNVDINETIDQDLASKGTVLFNNLCSACHKFDKKFVGPALSGVTERRSPEWIMNMILNPEQMIKEDPIAKKLLIESNMAMMADQNLSEEEARAILEYFRQLDQQNQ